MQTYKNDTGSFNFDVPCLFRLFVCFRFSSGIHEKEKKGIRTAADSGQSGWPLWHPKKARSLRTQAQLIETETRTETLRNENFEKEQRKTGASRRYRRHIMETYLLE
ncbi:hypothetical protein TNCV_2427681 [Trichonephila clavipes]|nr:hypothetical protein TNCV_2427681 [Trichonephila clavipes]